MFEDYWKNTSTEARVSLLAGLFIVVALTVWMYFWATSEEYAVLYSNLSESDAAQITAELKDNKQRFKLEQGGKTILVLKEELDQIRLELAGSTLPINGGQGFELFDNIDYGMTEFVQNINYQRAMQGELSRTISAMPEIQSARVHLVLPKESLFQKNQEQASASVVLHLLSGRMLAPDQVESIQNLVASSVEGVSVSQVLVVDDQGKTLSDIHNPDELDLSANFKYKQQVESYLVSKASKALEPVFGVGKSFVFVNADIDFDEVKRQQETYMPDDSGKGIISKSKVTTSNRENNVSGKKAKDEAKQKTEEFEYKVGKSVEQVVENKGEIKRLTISVLVPQGIEETRSILIKQLVSSAIGFNKNRGDEIFVGSMASPEHSLQPVKPEIKPAVESPAINDVVLDTPSGTFLQRHLLAILAGLILLLLSLVIVLFIRLKSLSSRTSLTEDEREQLLADVQSWMKS